MAEDKSAWAQVGIGCLTLALIVVAVVAGGGFWLHRNARNFERSMSDPAARAARVREVLGLEESPEGYHEMMAFRIPFVMQVAILSGRAAGPDGRPGSIGDRGLIYIESLEAGKDPRGLRAYFEGRTTDPAVLAEHQIQIEVDEVVRRGVVGQAGATLLYLSQRGRIAVEGFHGEGVTSLILVECPGDRKSRLAIWFVPDPDPGLPVALVDFTGTPADPEAIAAFMSHFRICVARGE